jgi:ADP-ribosylation factor family.
MNTKILFTIAATVAGLLFFKSSSKKPSRKTRRIVILGLKAAGKTTLWNSLRERLDVLPESTSLENVESFTVKNGDTSVDIAATKDIGGGDSFVPHYDELIKDGTLIYFLVDLNTIAKYKDDISDRLYKVFDVLAGGNGGSKKNDCIVQILATHKDTFLSNAVRHMPDSEIIEHIINKLDLTSVDGVPSDIGVYVKPINLLSSQNIQEIKNDIINC